MGFYDGPDPLPLDFFHAFRGEAEPGGKPLFALNPFSQFVVGFDSSMLSTAPPAVHQIGQVTTVFCDVTGTQDWVVGP
jgi:hypothetical protein